MKWEKTGRSVLGNGETTNYYESDNGQYLIESRKRAIPHANGIGSWMHTSYWLINADNLCDQKEFFSLKDAKDAAEKKVMGD